MCEEQWIATYEDHLLRIWDQLQGIASSTSIMVFDRFRLSFPEFCVLAYRNSTIPDHTLEDDHDADDSEGYGSGDDDLSSAIPVW